MEAFKLNAHYFVQETRPLFLKVNECAVDNEGIWRNDSYQLYSGRQCQLCISSNIYVAHTKPYILVVNGIELMFILPNSVVAFNDQVYHYMYILWAQKFMKNMRNLRVCCCAIRTELQATFSATEVSLLYTVQKE